MAHEFSQEEWRIIELGRAMYTIFQDAYRTYLDREFCPGYTLYLVSPEQRQAILQEADALARERGFENYDPSAYQTAVDMVRNAEQEDRNKASKAISDELKRERASEMKARLWEEVLVDELKRRGVYDKKVPLSELERRYISWQDDRVLRWDANSLAKSRGYTFRF